MASSSSFAENFFSKNFLCLLPPKPDVEACTFQSARIIFFRSLIFYELDSRLKELKKGILFCCSVSAEISALLKCL